MRVYIYLAKLSESKELIVKHVISRIPPDIKILNDSTVREILKIRVERKEIVNEWRKKIGKKKLERSSGWLITGWGLETDLEKMEIIEKYL